MGKDLSETDKFDTWTFECEECGLLFMHSRQFHDREYHGGKLLNQVTN